MPTLDDAPTLEKLTPVLLTFNDLDEKDRVNKADVLQVYDISEQKAKTITIGELFTAVGAAPA